jgi:hypothetical protein
MTISEIRNRNGAAGQHWFEPATLRFFRSKVLSAVYEGPGGIYFVSSEQFVGSDGVAAKRKYTVRRFHPGDATIDTVMPFNELSLYAAQKLARERAAGGGQ